MAARVIVVMGVSGSGKTAVGRALANALGWTFVEGDEHHPQANVIKMSRGEALTDEDRGPWLLRLRGVIERHRTAGTRCVMTCSALKRAYREMLKRPGEDDVVFVHLEGAPELIRARMQGRAHFMKPEMLAGQLTALEAPDAGDAVVVGIDQPVEEIVGEIRRLVGV